MVKLDIKDFMDDWDEWHSFWVGFCESVHYRRPVIHSEITGASYIQTEYHYYMLGRTVGFIVLIGIIVGLVKLFV